MGGGDIVYARAHYCFYKADGSVFDQGKYVQARRTFCICVGAMTTNLSFQFNQNTILLYDMHISICSYYSLEVSPGGIYI